MSLAISGAHPRPVRTKRAGKPGSAALAQDGRPRRWLTRARSFRISRPVKEAPDLRAAVSAIEELYRRALPHVIEHVTDAGKISAKKLDAHQLSAHALAYLAT